MHRFRGLVALTLFIVASFAFTADAQHYPWPKSTSESPSICTHDLCESSKGLPTYQYSLPIKRHVGRTVDSQHTRDHQAGDGMRTLRSKGAYVVPEMNRVYLIQGETFAAYDLSTFFTSTLGSPLTSLSGVRRDNDPEQYLAWKYHVYPEGKSSGWITGVSDSQERLYDADWDDRSNVYLAYSLFGWGIVKDSGSGFTLVKQSASSTGATKIMTVKIGTKYYAFVTHKLAAGDGAEIYDVTTPSSPSFLRKVAGATSWAKVATSAGYDVAITDQDGNLQIFDAADYIAGRPAKQTILAATSADFIAVSSDGDNFIAVEGSPSKADFGSISFLDRQAGGSYLRTKISLPGFMVTGAKYGSGYLAVWGLNSSYDPDTRLFKVSASGEFTSINLGSFLPRYYLDAPAGYAKPFKYTTRVRDVTMFRYSGKDYMIYGQHGLGDVYEIATSAAPVVPDPLITKSGCVYVDRSCTLTATSRAGEDRTGWTYEWKNGGGTVVGTASTYSPSLPTEGSYTFSVKATNTVGNATDTTTFSVVPVPPPTVPDPVIAKTGCTTVGGACSLTTNSASSKDQTDWSYAWRRTDSTTVLSSSRTYSPNTTTLGEGTFSFTVTASNTAGSDTETVSFTLSVSSCNPLPSGLSTTVGFSGPTSGCSGSGGTCGVNETLSFNATTYNGLSNYTLQACDELEWNWGDGTSATNSGQDKGPITHRYTSAGTYTVTLKVKNPNGDKSGTKTVRVGTTTGTCDPLASNVTVGVAWTGPTSACSSAAGGACAVNENVAFNANTYAGLSNYTLKSCETIEWNFGDGSAVVNTGQSKTTSHIFTRSGTFNVTVKIKNPSGDKSGTKPITIGGTSAVTPPSAVNYTATPASPKAGQAVTFQGTATGTVTSWTWTIDGVAKTGQNVTHTFAAPGSKSVVLVAANSAGSASISRPLTVASQTEFAYLLPSVAHLPGAQGSQWRTDLQMYNPAPSATAPLVLNFEFRSKSGATVLKQVTTSNSTLILADLLGEIVPGVTNDAGIVIIRGDGAPGVQFWTRNYSIDAAGTGSFGQLQPAIPLGTTSAATAGESVYLLPGLENPSDVAGDVRTNIAFINPTGAATTAHVELFDESDNYPLGEFDVAVGAYQLKQLGNSDIRGLVPTIPALPYRFTARVSTESSDLITYASIIDQISNDPVYVAAVPERRTEDPNYADQLIPAIRVGAWRSDITIYNPGAGLEVALDFYDRTGARLSGTSSNIRIGTNEFVTVEDVLTAPEMTPALFDSLGVVRVRTMAPADASRHPVVFGRNYNIGDGAHGTFGHETVAIPLGGGNVRAGAPSILPSLRSNKQPLGELVGLSYYTNLNLFSLTDQPTTVLVTLLDEITGQAVGTYQVPQIAGRGTIVVSDILRLIHPAQADIADLRGTLKLEILGGPVHAFASVIDWKTKDAVAVPAIQLQN